MAYITRVERIGISQGWREAIALLLACPASSNDKYRGIRWRLASILATLRSRVTLSVIYGLLPSIWLES